MSFLSSEQLSEATSMLQASFTGALADPNVDTPPAAAPVAEAPPLADPPAPTPDPAPVADLVKVKVGEVEAEVTLEELKRDYAGRSASTKKFMEAAEIRKAAEAERTQVEAVIEQVKAREAAFNKLLSDPVEVERYLTYLRGGQPQGAPAPSHPNIPAGMAGMDPNMPVTFGEVQSLLMANAQQSGMSPAQLQAYAQQIQQQAAQAAQAQAEQTYAEFEQGKIAISIQTRLESAVESAVKANPILGGLDQAELVEALCDQAQKMDPGSVEEAVAFINDLASQRAERLTSTALSLRKEQAVAKASLEKGIEPPVVAPVSNSAPTKSLQLGTKEFQAAAAAELTRIMQQRRR